MVIEDPKAQIEQAWRNVAAWLKQFSQMVGSYDFHMREDGICAFELDNIPVVIETPEFEETVLFYSHLAPIPDFEPETLFRVLLEMNFLMRATAGATLAIDREYGSFALCLSKSTKELNSNSFCETMRIFLEQSQLWATRVRELVIIDNEVARKPVEVGPRVNAMNMQSMMA